MPLAAYQRFNKHFGFAQVASADLSISAARAIKSPYELERMIESGKAHQRILEQRTPELFREGMSEAEFAAELYPVMIQEA